MDPVTHTLVGLTVAQAFLRKRAGAVAMPLMAVASNLPDIDAVAMLFPVPAAITFRRTFGHSLFLLPIWCYLLAKLFQRKWPQEPTKKLFWLCALACGLHLFFDLVNSFGVLLLWPLRWRPEFGTIFIVDLALTALLALPHLADLLPDVQEYRGRIARVGLALVCGYVGLCFGLRQRATNILADAREGLATDFSYVFPEPFGPNRWRGVARSGSEYRLYLIDALESTIEARESVYTQPDDPATVRARASPVGRRLEGFFKAPVWRVEPGGGVVAYDLRFRPLLLERAGSFEYRLPP